jgi:hypothetical protein
MVRLSVSQALRNSEPSQAVRQAFRRAERHAEAGGQASRQTAPAAQAARQPGWRTGGRADGRGRQQHHKPCHTDALACQDGRRGAIHRHPRARALDVHALVEVGVGTPLLPPRFRDEVQQQRRGRLRGRLSKRGRRRCTQAIIGARRVNTTSTTTAGHPGSRGSGGPLVQLQQLEVGLAAGGEQTHGIMGMGEYPMHTARL